MKNIYLNLIGILFVSVIYCTSAKAQTSVQFSAASANVTETETSIDLTIEITNADATNATTVEIGLSNGSAVEIGNYTTQTATFAAASTASEVVTISITDDANVEAAEVLTFTLQNVAGGDAAEIGAQATFELTIIDDEITASDLIINEILADPASGTPGDANNDGVRDAADDEFIELVNTGVGDLDVSGYELFDTNSTLRLRHTFPTSSIIPAGGAIVVFGGGSPVGTFGNSVVQVASSGGVGATNDDDTFIIKDASDQTIIFYTYGNEAEENQSITRDVDISGSDAPMTKHSVATNANGALFSPGTKIDGSLFIVPAATEVQFEVGSMSVNEADGSVDLTVLIAGEDDSNATMVEVAITSGTASDVSNYTTQTLTFPAASAASQSTTITLVNDTEVEGDETITFTLGNVSGGNSAEIGATNTLVLTIVDNDYTPTDLVVNEFLAYPSSTGVTDDNEVDANGNGSLGGTSDEFVELVNSGDSDLDISNWKINDGSDRHIFEANTIIRPGGAIVVFAGSPVGTFGNSLLQTASSGGLGLSNSGDSFYIKDDTDEIRLAVSYDAATVGVAMTRNPDITGLTFSAHPVNDTFLNDGGTGATTSPGTKIDGSYFIPEYTWDGSVWDSGVAPTTVVDAVINGDYDFSIDGSFAADNLTVNTSMTLTVDNNATLEVTGGFANSGTVIVTSGASLLTWGAVSGADYQIERQTTFDTNTGRYSVVGSPIETASFDVLGVNSLVYGYDQSELYNPTGNLGLDRFKTPDELGHATMELGVGYFSGFTGDANGLVSFVGTPNTGTINVALAYTDHPTSGTSPDEDELEGFNLVSNPYPSAVSFTNLMAENVATDIEKSVYIWDDQNSANERGTNEDYLIVNALGNTDSREEGEAKWDGFIRSGQGFFVKANSASTLIFNNDTRVTGSNTDASFYRSQEVIDHTMKLVLSNDQTMKSIVIGYADDATVGSDQKYDAISLSSGAMQLYSLQVASGLKLGIQGVPTDFNENIDLGFKVASEGEYTISTLNTDFGDESVLLTDHLLGATVNLQIEDYKFTSSVGEYSSRFSIRSTLSILDLEEINEESFYSFSSSGQLNIVFANSNLDHAKFSLVGLTGLAVEGGATQIGANHWVMNTSGLPKSIYVLMIETAQGTWKRKVITK